MSDVKIGHMRIKLRFEDDLDVRGEFRADRREIVLLRELPPGEAAEVLLHELIHAGMWAYGHSDRKFTEEDACSVASRVLAQVLIDNREVRTLLTQFALRASAS